nr:MAG TPA: hypothetical protein [Caudoviricetes sp.]
MGTYGNKIIPLVVPLYPHAPKPNLKSKWHFLKFLHTLPLPHQNLKFSFGSTFE